MNITATLARCILASSFLAAAHCAEAETNSAPPLEPSSASQPSAENPAKPECTQGLSDAEISLERGRQLAAMKRWKDALSPLREANSRAQSLAANCPALAVQANRLGETAAGELRVAESSASHQNDCQPRLDKALDLDIRAATAKRENRDASDIERLLAEAESNWRDAASHCQPPHREKAERYLNSTIRARAANAEMLSNSPACDSAWKNAGALGELAKGAWKDKHWDESASLYHKAVMAWETASDNCTGARQLQAQKKIEQTQLDAHNAEHCGPRWDSATELTQQAKTNAATATLAERDQFSVKAEVAWRNAVALCKGAPQSLARNNADALARERGAPLPPSAIAQIAKPLPGPVAVVDTPPSAASGIVSGNNAPSPAPAQTNAKAPVVAPAASASSTRQAPEKTSPAPTEPQVIVAGDTTYRGKFSIDKGANTVSGEGIVEWPNGDRYNGQLAAGKRQGKGRFTWGNGQWYEGDWQDDIATGHGLIAFTNGNRYEGSVINGQPNGRGTLSFATGERYTGEFSQGNFHGQGSYFWKDGDRYDGAWVVGAKHGLGRFSSADGSGWEGEYRDDEKTDNGKRLPASAIKTSSK